MTAWNFADVWETAAECVPDAPAVVQGGRSTTWAAFDRRADGVARSLLDHGLQRGTSVALYLYNSPQYLEASFAAMKIGLAPVNTNYRYGDDELAYLWDNADAAAVVFHGTFTERVERLRRRLDAVRLWLWVDDGSGPQPPWAVDYEQAATAATQRVRAPWGRGGDDLLLLYTGGTTGMPKGVMWRQDDLFCRLNRGNLVRVDEEGGLDAVRAVIGGPGPALMPACPLMHGTGMFTSIGVLNVGGRVVLLEGRHFDPLELFGTVDTEQVNVVTIVGDAFARPMLAALDQHPGRFELDSLIGMISSGVMWSEETKQGLLRHLPSVLLIDAFSSSEALGMGTSVSSAQETRRTATFSLGPDVRVIDVDSGRDVEPGSGASGLLALGGRNPIGYHKDPDRSAATFRVIDGQRFSVPGDFAMVEADGTVRLLGRGSVCINTGGEKVFPEEVEEVLKRHRAVRDAVAVPLADPTFVEVVAAVVELHPGSSATEAELRDHVRASLAAYKAPKRVMFVDTIGRSPSGKVDYARHRRDMAQWAGVTVGSA